MSNRLTPEREEELRHFGDGWTGVTHKALFSRDEVRALTREMLAEVDALRVELAAVRTTDGAREAGYADCSADVIAYERAVNYGRTTRRLCRDIARAYHVGAAEKEKANG